ncbi:MAG: GyrI-like domain-containing protein [Chloroflexota bacterium]|nr:GyrI-like domain-containing protein [Chloroflexota bacterium]
MSKTDFKKEWKHLYRPSAKEFVVVDVPPMNFLMIDGHGDPNTAQEYQDAVEALYGMAYKIKFMSKKEIGKDYVIPPMEGLWWVENMDEFTTESKSSWDWTMMIMQPEWITQEMFEEALKQVEKKKNPPALPKIRLEVYHEGLAVQIMHIGPFDAEAPTITRMHTFIDENSYEPAGKHHEIYLGDPRKVAPEKLKTVLRQPVRKV